MVGRFVLQEMMVEFPNNELQNQLENKVLTMGKVIMSRVIFSMLLFLRI